MVTSTTLVGMQRKLQLVTVVMNNIYMNIPPRSPSRSNETIIVTLLNALRMVRLSKLEWKRVTQLGALERQQSLTGIKSMHKSKS